MPTALPIAIQYATARVGLPHRRSVERWIAAALGDGRRSPIIDMITVRFVDRPEGRRLNRTYRHRDYATNVLTFSTPLGASPMIAGDIALCAPVVAAEARAFRRTKQAHYAHLVVHAMLHLQGHDHGERRARARMEASEKAILERLGYADPYWIEE